VWHIQQRPFADLIHRRNTAVYEQGSATQEIARDVQEAAKGAREVSSSISSLIQVVSETGAAANQVLERFII